MAERSVTDAGFDTYYDLAIRESDWYLNCPYFLE